MQILMPTMYRESTGFRYLYKTFDNLDFFFKSFNIEYDLHLYQRKIPKQQEIHINSTSLHRYYFNQNQDYVKRIESRDLEFELEQLLTKYEAVTIQKMKKWHNQALDWVEMMKLFYKSNCGGQKIFLYLEDDFQVCENAFPHLLSIYQWAEMHLDHWKVIRMTFGFSGLLFQCRDIPKYLEIIEKKSINSTFPIDTALALSWDPHENMKENLPRLHYTYRYILFEHIGYESSVGNMNQRLYQCFGLMKSKVFHYQEQFDWDCEGFMLSPCQNEIVKELEFRSIPDFDIPLNVLSREKLIKRINHEIVVDSDYYTTTDCNQLCQDQGMICNTIAFQMINNCDLLKEKFNRDCRCYNMIDDETSVLPLYDYEKNRCKTLINLNTACDGFRWGNKRICTCKKVDSREFELQKNDTKKVVLRKRKMQNLVKYQSLSFLLGENYKSKDPKMKMIKIKRKIVQAMIEKQSPKIGPSTKLELEKRILEWKQALKQIEKVIKE